MYVHTNKHTQVAAGDMHSAAMTEGGELWTWGDGRDGRLGHGNELLQLVPTLVAAVRNVCLSVFFMSVCLCLYVCV